MSAHGINNELTQKNKKDMLIDSDLLEFHKKNLDQYKHQWNLHSITTLNRQTLSRVLFFNKIYKKILNSHGVICEFGVQWGTTMALLLNLRGIYEPYNASRKIIGFDTFEGLKNVDILDGLKVRDGDYKTSNGYEFQLDKLLQTHEANSPISHIKKYDLIVGDASITVKDYLKDNPETIISLAIFDMDIYKPTKDVLLEILPRMHKGSLIVFDELCCPHFPGETIALLEAFKVNKIKIKRDKNQIYCAYVKI